MDATLVAWVLLLATPFVAHAVGAIVASRLGPGRNGAADRMPSLPSRDAGTDPPGRRFDRAVGVAEHKILRLLRKGNRTLDAGEVAAAIGEPPSVVEAVLARWRARIPCRLRVTARGTLLHDFEDRDLARVRRDRVLGGPARAALFVLSAAANVGAAWPMVAVAGLSIAGFATMFTTDDDTPWWVGGVVAVAGIGAVVLVVWLASRLVALLARPWRNDPRSGDADAADAGKAPAFGPGSGVPNGGGSGGGSVVGKVVGNAFELAGEGLGPILAVALVVALLLAFAGAVVGIALWVRGVWRSVSGRNAPDEDTSPAAWIASAKRPDGIEAWFPSTDLVIGILRTIRTAMARPRPPDGGLPARVLALAARQGGWVSRTDLVLAEGLPPDEALAVGARLSGLQGGDLCVRPDGTIDFAFPEATARPGDRTDAASDAPADRLHECLAPRGGGAPASVPVALPGLAWGHVRASWRLAAGSFLLAIGSVATSAFLADPAAPMPIWAGVLLPALNLGVFSIVTAGTYAVSATASLSVLRDARRRTFAEVRAGLDRGDDTLASDDVVAGLRTALRAAWPGVPEALLRREVQQALLDLDLAVDLAATAERSGKPAWDLRPLREARDAVEAARRQAAPDRRPETPGDAIVFDTRAADRQTVSER